MIRADSACCSSQSQNCLPWAAKPYAKLRECLELQAHLLCLRVGHSLCRDGGRGVQSTVTSTDYSHDCWGRPGCPGSRGDETLLLQHAPISRTAMHL